MSNESTTMTLKAPAGQAQRTGARAIVETLESLGVRHIFGIPGGNVIPLYDALHVAASLRSILVRHEEGAVHAAHGYAIASGQVGVCLATSGPGATNLITGIAEALADSAPVLVLTGAVFSTLQGTDAFQDADILGMTEGITKHSFRVIRPDDIAPTLIAAHQIATSGRPGPVLIDITKDAQQGIDAMQAGQSIRTGFRGEPALSSAVLTKLALSMSAAERPLIAVGTGVVRSDATAELRAFAHRIGAGVMTSAAAHGAISDEDPSSLGLLDSREAEIALARCDALITFGLRPSAVRSLAERVWIDSPVVQVDVDPSQLRSTGTILPIMGDARVILAALTDRCSLSSDSSMAWIEEPNRSGPHGWDRGLSALPDPDSVLALISALTYPDSMFVSEYPEAVRWRTDALRVTRASQFFTSGGFVERGFAIPAALGAKFARPERTVWAVTDSAGFQVSARELTTSAVAGAPIKVAVFSRASDTRLVPDVGLLGEASGALAVTVESASGLWQAIDLALQTVDRSVVLDFQIDW